ncbi:replication initiator [Bifidobacterium bifidum]|uniref:replication initiator n=1 Tax=Bifidobacterium bifidum TaxID=1681 RepID=UPI0034A32B2B
MDKDLVQKLIEQTRNQVAASPAAGDTTAVACSGCRKSARPWEWRCENPHFTPDGRQTPCGHCPACLRRKRYRFVRKGEAGLGKPGIYVFVTLTAPGFVRPGVPVHVAPKEGEARRRCPACGKYHEPGFALSGLPMDFGNVDFMGLALFNLSLSDRLNAMLTRMRKEMPGAAVLYVKDLQARLAAHVHMLIRLPEETWRVKLDLDRSMHMRGKRVESCFVECLRGTLAPGWGPRMDIQLVGDLDEYAGMIVRHDETEDEAKRDVTVPVIEDARKIVWYMFMFNGFKTG